MPAANHPPEKKHHKETKEKLPLPWQQVQGAIWLLGLAVLAWQDWWWPGILVLVAISGLSQAAIQMYVNRQVEEEDVTAQEVKIAQERANWLPSVCPKCGGPLSVSEVKWTGPNTGDCPYCNANLRPEK